MVLNTFKSVIFTLQSTKGTCLKILTLKQMLDRLTIALVQVIAGNTSENLLNEICQIIYSLFWEKEIIQKVYNNTMNWIGYNTKWILYI